MNTVNIIGDYAAFQSELFSYSTADIESTIFFGAMKKAPESSEIYENAHLLLVHGEMYRLIEDVPPQLPVPSSNRPALIDILNLDLLETQA